MLPIALILGTVLAGGAVVGIVAAFWDNIKKFLRKAVEKVRSVIRGVLYGCKVFLKKTGEAVKEISRHYSKVDGQWEETTVIKTVSESEVPKEFLERAREQEELDITDECEMQLAV